jgi:23S rRNA (guanosine2251-2'-O)-methyltransferase
MIIEGAISVKAAITNHKREISEVIISKDKHTRDFRFITGLLLREGIPFRKESSQFFLDHPKAGGIIAQCSARRFEPIEELSDHIMVIDGVQDPFNLAYILRSGKAFEHSFIINSRESDSYEAGLLKSSAGAYDMLKIAASDDLFKDIKSLKEKGYQINALSRVNDSIAIEKLPLGSRYVMIIGGEKRGYQKGLEELIDNHVHIEYDGDFRNALNASSAAAIALNVLSLKNRGVL